MSNYTAIILAAGQGTRLRPITDDIPKCMVEIAGKPILNHQLDILTEAGIENIVVVTGYLEEEIQDPRITKVHNPEYASTNMIYSLFCAEEDLEGDVIVAYGDIIYSKEVLNNVMDPEGDIVTASDEEWLPYWEERCDDPLTDAETFKKGKKQKVVSLGQEAESIDEIEGQFTGLIKLSSRGCSIFKETYHDCKKNDDCHKNAWESNRDLRNAYMTDILNYLADKGEVHYTSIQRGWFEVDNPRDLEIANKKLGTFGEIN